MVRDKQKSYLANAMAQIVLPLFGGRGLNKIFFEKGVLGGAESITKYS
jgi:hypothetical protein